MASDWAWSNYVDREYILDDGKHCPWHSCECCCDEECEESEDEESDEQE